ncbi:MAG: SPASM domain-containing protein [Phycisphaerales bacterium]|nr:SPASM domain-containing protein [Phycisphaerales bacterium]
MKTVALLDADLESTPLGTASRLGDDLAGAPVVRRTVERLAQCERLADIVVSCPPNQQSRVAELLNGTPAKVYARNTNPPSFRALVRAARKWSLDGWRGGLGGSTSLDEYVDPVTCCVIAEQHQADALAVCPPGAALLDPALTDEMLAHSEKYAEESKLTFSQAPPGLLPMVCQTQLCSQLAAQGVPPGWALAYKPDSPGIDLVMRSCNFPLSRAARYAAGRLTADTARSFRTMRQLLDNSRGGSVESICNWLNQFAQAQAGELPREIEIELTTDDPLPESPLRPRGRCVPRRGPIDVATVARLAKDLSAADDDALVVLGGFGDPLLHPALDDVLAALRNGGVYGITVYTTGRQLSDDAIAALVRHRVDVAVFHVDAWTPETYQSVTGGCDLQTVRDAITRLCVARTQAAQPEPIVVPQMTKAATNVEELDVFFNGWLREQGWATIAGFSHFSGRLPDLTVVDMAPPHRQACRRLTSRCVVLADGRVSACDQDFTGELILGDLAGESLRDIWAGPAARKLRARHLAGELGDFPLCAGCSEWHRP